MLVRALTSSGGGSETLLWTESHAGQDDYTFEAQTISLNLSGYSHVLIWCCYSSYQAVQSAIDDVSYQLIPIDGNQYKIYGGYYTGNNNSFSCRPVTVTSSGVTFGIGRRSGYSTNYNTRAYPWKIYGVKIS